jgi:hypothetical protein
VELPDGKYGLAIGEIRLVLRLPLPIHPRNNVTIQHFGSFEELQRAWEECENSFETRGDYESANNMCATWSAWTESALAFGPSGG